LQDVCRHEHHDRRVTRHLPLCSRRRMSQRDPQRMPEGAGRKHLIRIADDLCAKMDRLNIAKRAASAPPATAIER
jgi:hypothetical protein